MYKRDKMAWQMRSDSCENTWAFCPNEAYEMPCVCVCVCVKEQAGDALPKKKQKQVSGSPKQKTCLLHVGQIKVFLISKLAKKSNLACYLAQSHNWPCTQFDTALTSV